MKDIKAQNADQGILFASLIVIILQPQIHTNLDQERTLKYVMLHFRFVNGIKNTRAIVHRCMLQQVRGASATVLYDPVSGISDLMSRRRR